MASYTRVSARTPDLSTHRVKMNPVHLMGKDQLVSFEKCSKDAFFKSKSMQEQGMRRHSVDAGEATNAKKVDDKKKLEKKKSSIYEIAEEEALPLLPPPHRDQALFNAYIARQTTPLEVFETDQGKEVFEDYLEDYLMQSVETKALTEWQKRYVLFRGLLF